MTDLSDKDIERIADAIAPRLVDNVQKSHHELWIDPKSHYDAHKDLTDMLGDYKMAKGIFWRVFLTAIAFAGIISAGWALYFGGKK